MSTETQTAGPVLRAHAVSKWFGSAAERRCVLTDINLDIRKGEIISIIGRSGVGKSTLLRMFGGLLDADEGEITFNGQAVQVARAAKTFGLMPQSPALFPWRTVAQNVALPGQVNRNRGAQPLSPLEALSAVGLVDRAESRPSELSGGMKQRVAMARALATQAPVLLLDEPFSALDEMTRDELYEQVLKIWNDGAHTLVLVTHNITEAVLLSDRVVVLSGMPAQVVDVVEVSGARPRLSAIDNGHYAEVIKRLRRALEGDAK